MALQLTAESLEDWDAYHAFTKERLKQARDGENPIFVTKDKITFSSKYKGHAFLIGDKCRITMQTLRKQGVICIEGVCTLAGKEIGRIEGIRPKLVTETRKTVRKLKLGYKVARIDGEEPVEGDGEDTEEEVAGDAEGGAGARASAAQERSTGPLDALIAKLVPMAKAALDRLPGDQNQLRELIDDLVALRKLGQIDKATERAKELSSVLKSAPTAAAGAGGTLDLRDWIKARDGVLGQFAKFAKALRATGDEELGEALAVLAKLEQRLSKELSSKEDLDAMVTFVEKDEFIRELDGQLVLGVDLDLSRPLLAALESALRSAAA